MGEIHTPDMEVGQQSNIIITSDELLGQLRNKVAPVDPKIHKNYLADLAFMEEEIEIMVHEDVNPNAENPVIAGNNGRTVIFPRGVPVRCKRKFVDSLIVKHTNVTTNETVTHNNEKSFAVKQVSAMKYPFTIIQDKNKKGAEWLRTRMAEKV